MVFFFCISSYHPRYVSINNCYQFHLKTWNLKLFKQKIKEALGILHQNKFIFKRTKNNLFTRSELGIYLLVNLQWKDLSFKIPMREFSNKQPLENILKQIEKLDLNDINNGLYTIEANLQFFLNKITIETAVSKFLEKNNYEFTKYLNGEFFAKFPNSNKEFSLMNDNDFRFIMELFHNLPN